MSSAERFDVVVIGCGPAGERAAIQAARAGRRVAVVERAHVVGGTGVNWGTIPSKTLRESALFVHALTRARLHGIRYELGPEITVADFTYRQRLVVQRELELINEGLAKARIEVRRGHGRFLDPHTVALFDDQGWQTGVLEGEIIVIATGSSPNHPPDVPFDDRMRLRLLDDPLPPPHAALHAGAGGRGDRHRVRLDLRRPRHPGDPGRHAGSPASLPRSRDRRHPRAGNGAPRHRHHPR